MQACRTAPTPIKAVTMPESTPLLPKVNRPPHEHPIFHRVCHSPWLFINQRSLLALRGFLAIYMSVMLVLELSFEIFQRESGRYFVFLISNFSYAIQTTYYWITFVSPVSRTSVLADANNTSDCSSGQYNITLLRTAKRRVSRGMTEAS